MEVFTLLKTAQIWSWNMRELYCFSDFTHLRMLENNNKNVIKMIYKVFAFLELYFLQQYPTFLKKSIQKIRGKKIKFTLEPEFETVSLLCCYHDSTDNSFLVQFIFIHLHSAILFS